MGGWMAGGLDNGMLAACGAAAQPARHGPAPDTPHVHVAATLDAALLDRRRAQGIFWQEEIIPFFQKMELSPENKDAFSCMLEIAEKVRGGGAVGGAGARQCAAAGGGTQSACRAAPAWMHTLHLHVPPVACLRAGAHRPGAPGPLLC